MQSAWKMDNPTDNI